MASKTEFKVCAKCTDEKKISEFYTSFSPLDLNGKTKLCKKCIQDMVNINDAESMKNMLRSIDKPFVIHLYESALTKNAPIGEYFKLINAKDYRYLTWANSTFKSEKKETSIDQEESNEYLNFKPTPEVIMRWGSNHSPEDFIKLEDFYNKMKLSNRIETPQDETYLKKLSVISLKMDQELESGNYGQVKQLGDLFSKYMGDSKFRAMDKTEADKTGGIRNFGSIYAEVEKDGHIPPWEHYRKLKGISQDIVDKTIMHIENFTLRLNKIERMTEPPDDTPKLTKDDVRGDDV